MILEPLVAAIEQSRTGFCGPAHSCSPGAWILASAVRCVRRETAL